MKPSMLLKVLAIALVVESFGLVASAMAADGANRDAAIGIIGEVVNNAIEKEQEKQEAREQQKQCARLQYKCKHGSEWACEKYEESCGD
jgi:hypothetical protein